MEQKIRLDGHLAILDFSMQYEGGDHERARHQEMPALFIDGELKRFFYWKDEQLTEASPRILGENGKEGQEGLSLGKSSKAWVAYVDEKSTALAFSHRAPLSLHATAPWVMERLAQNGSACSYVAPIRTFVLKKGMALKYRIYLTTGSLQEIQSRFAKY